MDALTIWIGDVSVETLTEARAQTRGDELLEMAGDVAWDYWDREHLMSPRPEKWERSLLMCRAGRPVAWAVVSRTDDGAHLHHIVVARTERSHGVGTSLILELLRRTRTGTLTLKVHPENGAAMRFYRRLGFEEGHATTSGYRVFSRSVGEGEGSTR